MLQTSKRRSNQQLNMTKQRGRTAELPYNGDNKNIPVSFNLIRGDLAFRIVLYHMWICVFWNLTLQHFSHCHGSSFQGSKISDTIERVSSLEFVVQTFVYTKLFCQYRIGYCIDSIPQQIHKSKSDMKYHKVDATHGEHENEVSHLLAI